MSVIGERPGIYTDYEVSRVLYAGTASGTVGVAAGGAQNFGEVTDITTYAGAAEKFGENSNITELIRILIQNGVGTIKAVALDAGKKAPETGAYKSAFEKLAAVEDIKVIICDSGDAAVHNALKMSILETDQRNTHKIGVVESTGETAALISAAKAINCERMVMVAPHALCADGRGAVTGSLAAAVAGAIASEPDPAVPLNGAELLAIDGISAQLTDGDITQLVRGGVTPVECAGGTISVVRGVTTKTMTNGVADHTYRELTTMLIIDNVIPSVRDALRNSFTRAKNTAQTRGAIRTQVIIELEKKLQAEIIDSYENVSVTQSGDDPTVCIVSFDFTVAHGLNQIRLTAYITV